MRAGGTPIRELRVDGGASAMDAMLQFQADLLGVAVSRPTDQETTALGAAFLAGLAEGVFPGLDDIGRRWKLDATFEPAGDRSSLDASYATWLRAGRSVARFHLAERQPAPEVATDRRGRSATVLRRWRP